MKKTYRCRYCRGRLLEILSLGDMPLVNYFPRKSEVGHSGKYPLDFLYCPACGLAQIGETVAPQRIFTAYHYVTGVSAPLVLHLTELAQTCIRMRHLTKNCRVLDIGCNDGTLLSAFQKHGMRVVGVEPAKNIVRIAKKRGFPVISDFFNTSLARTIRRTNGQFDLISATHTLANIPDLSDFLRGVKYLLAPKGVFVVEVASLEEMLAHGHFDAVYHEHYFYFSKDALTKLLADSGLTVVDVMRYSAQGGSLLLFATHDGTEKPMAKRSPVSEKSLTTFARNTRQFRTRFRNILDTYRGKTVVGFGAPAKAVTLLNWCGISADQMAYIVDATKLKHQRLMPGVNIPIYKEEYLKGKNVDAIVMLAWNYQDEILPKISQLVGKRTPVIIPFPKLETVPSP